MPDEAPNTSAIPIAPQERNEILDTQVHCHALEDIMPESQQQSIGQELLKLFGAVRIINLETRSDRRQEMMAELEKIGLVVTPDGPVRFHTAARFTDAGPFPLIGARGCWDSHVSILKEALDGQDNILILEDDCDFVAGIEDKLRRALTSLSRSDWSIFYGGHDLVDQPRDACDSIHIDHGVQWLRGTHCVGFNRAILEKLVATLDIYLADLTAGKEGAPKGIDSGYSRFRQENLGLNTYLAWPKLSFQRPSHSDISGVSTVGRFVPDCLLSIIRGLKRYVKRARTA